MSGMHAIIATDIQIVQRNKAKTWTLEKLNHFRISTFEDIAILRYAQDLYYYGMIKK